MKVTQSCPTLWPHGLYSPWNSPGQNTGVGSCYLLQGIFPTQGSKPSLLHCRWFFISWAMRGAWKATLVSTNRWWCVYVCVYIYLHTKWNISHKKNEILPFVTTWSTWMVLCLVKEVRERQILYNFTYMWSLKPNEQTEAEYSKTEAEL